MVHIKKDKLAKTQTSTRDGYVQKFDIQGALASTKRRRTCGTPSIGRSRCNAGDRTFYDAIKKSSLPLRAGIFFLFFVSLVPFNVFAESTVYVRPQSKVTIRTGQGNDFKIVAMASTGQKLTLLEEGDGWSLVRTGDGKEGWILERFLSSDAPLGDVVRDLQDKLDASRKIEKGQVEQISAFTTRLDENEHQLSQCRQQYDEISSSYETLKRDKANVIEMRQQLEGQEEEHRELIQKVNSLETQNKALKKKSSVNWFLAGGGVFLLGWLMGLINRKTTRRRSSLL